MNVYKLVAKLGTTYKGDPEHTLEVKSYEVIEKPKSYMSANGGMRIDKAKIGVVYDSVYDHAIYAETYATEELLEELKANVLTRVKERLESKLKAVRLLEKASKLPVKITNR